LGVWMFRTNVGRDFQPDPPNRGYHDSFTRTHALRARRAPQLPLQSYLTGGPTVGNGEAFLADHRFHSHYRSPLSPPQPYRDLDHFEDQQSADGRDPHPSVEEDDGEDDSNGSHNKTISGRARAGEGPIGSLRCEWFR
jgi:hypothetical protein